MKQLLTEVGEGGKVVPDCSRDDCNIVSVVDENTQQKKKCMTCGKVWEVVK